MSLYAYIKIPGIGGSESVDEVYGKDWIPITSMDFANTARDEDEEFTKAREASKSSLRQSQLNHLKSWYEKEKARGRLGDVTFEEFASSVNSDFSEILKTKDKQQEKSSATTSEPKKSSALEAAVRQVSRKEAGGTLTIDKIIDATSPKIQRLCLDCVNYDTDKYIEGTIELHICRHIPGVESSDVVDREIYLAYILDNCLIESVDIDASESNKLNEKIKITFEIIYSYILSPDGKLEGKGWNFVDEDKAGNIPPAPKVPGS